MHVSCLSHTHPTNDRNRPPMCRVDTQGVTCMWLAFDQSEQTVHPIHHTFWRGIKSIRRAHAHTRSPEAGAVGKARFSVPDPEAQMPHNRSADPSGAAPEMLPP